MEERNGMTKEEQETVITFDEASKTMNVYTASPRLMAKLDKQEAYEKWREHRQDGKVVAADYRADKKLLTMKSKRAKRVYTEEQKAAMRERLANVRAKSS